MKYVFSQSNSTIEIWWYPEKAYLENIVIYDQMWHPPNDIFWVLGSSLSDTICLAQYNLWICAIFHSISSQGWHLLTIWDIALPGWTLDVATFRLLPLSQLVLGQGFFSFVLLALSPVKCQDNAEQQANWFLEYHLGSTQNIKIARKTLHQYFFFIWLQVYPNKYFFKHSFNI